MLVRSTASRIATCIAVVLAAVCALLFALGISDARAESSCGSLSLHCVVERDGVETRLVGDEYSLARVATADVSDSGSFEYSTVPAFAEFDCAWGSLSATELSRKAALLERFASGAELFVRRATTDAGGMAYFGELEPGLYLVSRTDAASSNEEYACSPFLVSIPSDIEGTSAWNIVAYPKFERDVVKLRPCDMTVYMGGNDGYGNVDGVAGRAVSLPLPLYIVETPAGIEPEEVVLEDIETGGTWSLRFVGHDEWGEECYRLDICNSKAEEMAIGYRSLGGRLVSEDEFAPLSEHDLFKLYGIEIAESQKDVLLAHAQGRAFSVSCGSALLTVRTVKDDMIMGNSMGPVTQIAHAPLSRGSVPAGVGMAVAAPTTTFTLNETDIEIGSVRDPSGTASSARIGLLFDSIVNDGSDRESALRAKVDSVMPEVSQGCTRFYQSRYLDLVDMSDGNAWVVASQPVEVYWGYPEGTDEDTEFSLWHFGSLHRDGTSDPYESGYDLVDIERAQADSVPVEKTPQGIKFTVPSGGFSPFVLVWETGNMAGGDDPQGAIPLPGGGSGTSSLTQTGDALSIALIVVALAASFAVALAAYRKGKRACADEQDHHSA